LIRLRKSNLITVHLQLITVAPQLIIQSVNQSELKVDVIANPLVELELIHQSNLKNDPINRKMSGFTLKQSNAIDDLNRVHYLIEFAANALLDLGTYHLIARNIINTTVAEFKVQSNLV
jgi:hypothetical protein